MLPSNGGIHLHAYNYQSLGFGMKSTVHQTDPSIWGIFTPLNVCMTVSGVASTVVQLSA